MDRPASFVLRDYQQPVANAVFNYMLKNPGKHPLIALPTGSGKTVVLADVVKEAVTRWPGTKVLILSHVKEILSQNYVTLNAYFEQHGISTDLLGINSAGLGRRDTAQVTVAGIQSVYQNTDFTKYNLIIIDECHLIPFKGKGMYRTLFNKIKKARYVGLTATPFRLGGGYIYDNDDAIFDDCIYDLTRGKMFTDLIDAGYLCPLLTYSTDAEFDVKGQRIQAGDFIEKDLAAEFDREEITEVIVQKMIKAGADRKRWLIFAIDIAHAEHITESLMVKGIFCNVVHSKMEQDRDTVINDFRTGKYRAIVNVNVLTTGFDNPEIDMIVLARPTQSPVLHVQTVGRGLRIADGKENCMVLDFAGNTKRLGPINDIRPRKRRKTDEEGDAPCKECPNCHLVIPAAARVCPECGHKFQFQTKLAHKAGNEQIIARMEPTWCEVDDITYSLHTKHQSPDSVKVSYRCGLRTFNEWICLEHSGYAGHIAERWVDKRKDASVDMPESVVELLAMANDLDQPTQIQVKPDGKYVSICAYKFNL